MKWNVWITLERDGIARKHEVIASNRDQALALAEDLAVALYPMQGYTLTVWED